MIKKTNVRISGIECGPKQWFVCKHEFSVRRGAAEHVTVERGEMYCKMYETDTHVSLTSDFKTELVILKTWFNQYFSEDIEL